MLEKELRSENNTTVRRRFIGFLSSRSNTSPIYVIYVDIRTECKLYIVRTKFSLPQVVLALVAQPFRTELNESTSVSPSSDYVRASLLNTARHLRDKLRKYSRRFVVNGKRRSTGVCVCFGFVRATRREMYEVYDPLGLSTRSSLRLRAEMTIMFTLSESLPARRDRVCFIDYQNGRVAVGLSICRFVSFLSPNTRESIQQTCAHAMLIGWSRSDYIQCYWHQFHVINNFFQLYFLVQA